MKSSHFHSTLTHKRHNNMATIIKDQQTTQQQAVESANEYVDKVTYAVLAPLQKVATESMREGRADTPVAKTSAGVRSIYSAMVNKVKALNADTTKTEDAVALLQADAVDESLTKTRAIIDSGVRTINTLLAEQNGKLFSNSVDESPRGLSMLGNSQLLENVQADYLKFIDNKIVANAVNAFRIYGLLGGKEMQDSIARALNNRHSRETVEIMDSLNEQKEVLQYIDDALVESHRQLHTNAERIVGIRNRKV